MVKPRSVQATRAGSAAAERGGASSAQRMRELSVLNAIAEALNGSVDVQQALERTLGLVADLLGLRTGWVWLIDPESGHFYSAAVQNLPPYLQEPVRMTGRSCWCIESFKEGELSPRNVDVIECSRLHRAVEANSGADDLTEGLRYHASIPLYARGKRLGIMNLTAPAWRKLSRAELRLLSTIGYQVASAVERARLAETGAQLARAEERTRLAREIHDTLAQGLTAIGLHIEGALNQLQTNPDLARERLQRALATTRDSLEDARRSVLDLRATPLAGKPLAEALAALARNFTAETGVRVHVRADEVPSLPLRLEAELFRVTQEALANVRKHAHAQAVELRLQVRPAAVRLTIHDDGLGFDPQTAPAEPNGYGLQGMKERARLIGGRVRVHSRPGRGTTVSLTAPLAAEAGKS
jgi:two-component system, NarL family, sensor kinase